MMAKRTVSMKKRIFTMALTAVLAVSAFSLPAFAADDDNWYIDIAETPVCEDTRCGLLWVYPETQYQTVVYRTASGKVRTETNKIGCCS